MNEGQQRFYDFVMERVKEEKEEEIQAIMNESLKGSRKEHLRRDIWMRSRQR